jgi:hypothetical protein
VDSWDLKDGFNPADQISNVTFPYTVSLTGSAGGITIAASGLTTSSTSSTRITFSGGSNTVVVDTGTNPIAITSTVTSGAVKYALGGTFSAGLKFTSTAQFGMALSDLTVASDNGPAIYVNSAVRAFVVLSGTSRLTESSPASAAKSVPAGWGRGIGVKGAEGSTGFLIVNDGILSITTYDKAMTAKWKCYDSTAPADSDGDRVCDGNDPNPFVTINGGSLTIRATGVPCDPTDRMTYNTTTCTGTTSTKVSPEGIEAKSILTINGGTIDIQTTGDAMNAGIGYANPYGNAIFLNGGYLNAASSGNDGIDANARSSPGITVNGGVVIANGIGAPEEGFDADQYTVALNGGTAIGVGGGNSTVDSKSTARYAAISGVTSGKTLAIWRGSSTAGSLVFAYQLQATTGTGNTSRSALVSAGDLVTGGSYTYFLTAASNVTCSEWFHGLCVGTMSATYANLGTGTTLTVK